MEEINRKVDNAKKGIFMFLFTKVVPFAFPLLVGVVAAGSVTDVVNYVALIITFAVVSAALWIGLLIVGQKMQNRNVQMICRFFRRICFGAAFLFTVIACEKLGLIEAPETEKTQTAAQVEE